MNPADKHLKEMLDKWLKSLELHLKYSALDEDSYRRIQPWVPHDRPSRWIIELARQKLLTLREQHEARIAMGDAKFADSLELMGFLANLVGVQHIQRFIPLAEPQNEADTVSEPIAPSARTMTAEMLKPQMIDVTQLGPGITQPRKALHSADATREMPRPKLSATGNHALKRGAKQSARREETRDSGRDHVVVADAKRLLKWGRKWHELAELIARMADRPPLAEVRRILKEHKAELKPQDE